MTDEEVKNTARKKIYIISLIGLAIIVSLVSEWGIVYRDYPFMAVKQWGFYKAVLQNLILLAIIPYFLAYGAGKLLTCISIIMQDKKEYKPQYFVAWICLVLFSYYIGVVAIQKHDRLAMMIDGCVKTDVSSPQSQQALSPSLELICAKKVIPIFGALSACMRMALAEPREKCIRTVLTDADFQGEKST
jgi:hypothetical protein